MRYKSLLIIILMIISFLALLVPVSATSVTIDTNYAIQYGMGAFPVLIEPVIGNCPYPFYWDVVNNKCVIYPDIEKIIVVTADIAPMNQVFMIEGDIDFNGATVEFNNPTNLVTFGYLINIPSKIENLYIKNAFQAFDLNGNNLDINNFVAENSNVVFTDSNVGPVPNTITAYYNTFIEVNNVVFDIDNIETVNSANNLFYCPVGFSYFSAGPAGVINAGGNQYIGNVGNLNGVILNNIIGDSGSTYPDQNQWNQNNIFQNDRNGYLLTQNFVENAPHPDGNAAAAIIAAGGGTQPAKDIDEDFFPDDPNIDKPAGADFFSKSLVQPDTPYPQVCQEYDDYEKCFGTIKFDKRVFSSMFYNTTKQCKPYNIITFYEDPLAYHSFIANNPNDPALSNFNNFAYTVDGCNMNQTDLLFHNNLGQGPATVFLTEGADGLQYQPDFSQCNWEFNDISCIHQLFKGSSVLLPAGYSPILIDDSSKDYFNKKILVDSNNDNYKLKVYTMISGDMDRNFPDGLVGLYPYNQTLATQPALLDVVIYDLISSEFRPAFATTPINIPMGFSSQHDAPCNDDFKGIDQMIGGKLNQSSCLNISLVHDANVSDEQIGSYPSLFEPITIMSIRNATTLPLYFPHNDVKVMDLQMDDIVLSPNNYSSYQFYDIIYKLDAAGSNHANFSIYYAGDDIPSLIGLAQINVGTTIAASKFGLNNATIPFEYPGYITLKASDQTKNTITMVVGRLVSNAFSSNQICENIYVDGAQYCVSFFSPEDDMIESIAFTRSTPKMVAGNLNLVNISTVEPIILPSYVNLPNLSYFTPFYNLSFMPPIDSNKGQTNLQLFPQHVDDYSNTTSSAVGTVYNYKGPLNIGMIDEQVESRKHKEDLGFPNFQVSPYDYQFLHEETDSYGKLMLALFGPDHELNHGLITGLEDNIVNNSWPLNLKFNSKTDLLFVQFPEEWITLYSQATPTIPVVNQYSQTYSPSYLYNMGELGSNGGSSLHPNNFYSAGDVASFNTWKIKNNGNFSGLMVDNTTAFEEMFKVYTAFIKEMEMVPSGFELDGKNPSFTSDAIESLYTIWFTKTTNSLPIDIPQNSSILMGVSPCNQNEKTEKTQSSGAPALGIGLGSFNINCADNSTKSTTLTEITPGTMNHYNVLENDSILICQQALDVNVTQFTGTAFNGRNLIAMFDLIAQPRQILGNSAVLDLGLAQDVVPSVSVPKYTLAVNNSVCVETNQVVPYTGQNCSRIVRVDSVGTNQVNITLCRRLVEQTTIYVTSIPYHIADINLNNTNLQSLSIGFTTPLCDYFNASDLSLGYPTSSLGYPLVGTSEQGYILPFQSISQYCSNAYIDFFYPPPFNNIDPDIVALDNIRRDNRNIQMPDVAIPSLYSDPFDHLIYPWNTPFGGLLHYYNSTALDLSAPRLGVEIPVNTFDAHSVFLGFDDRQDFYYLEALIITVPQGPSIKVIVDAIGFPNQNSNNLVSTASSPITVKITAGDISSSMSDIVSYTLPAGTKLEPELEINIPATQQEVDTISSATDARLIIQKGSLKFVSALNTK